MKLGDLIREYREQHHMSQRQFALRCGLSNGYVSMLERGENPKTHKPVTPTLQQMKKLADGLGMTTTDLFGLVDDMPVELSTDKEKPDTQSVELNPNYYNLSPENKALIDEMIAKLVQSQGTE